jgi:predicted Zn-dependent peptidase
LLQRYIRFSPPTATWGPSTSIPPPVEKLEEKALRLILRELERVRQDGVTEEELDRVREQAKSNMVMELESTGAHMNRLARAS